MKRYNHASARLGLLAIIGIFFIGLNSCAKKINFSKSSVVPAAEGRVKIKKDKNKNYNVDVSPMFAQVFLLFSLFIKKGCVGSGLVAWPCGLAIPGPY